MTEYRRGEAREEWEILDFINLVFSQSSRPHHFEQLLPKVYGRPGFAPLHYLARQEGRLCAAVAVLPGEMRLGGGESLKYGYVGSVSVHSRYRGQGHMQKLMRSWIADCRAEGYDLLALGGQRQRYGYYGFEQGGAVYDFVVTDANIRHGLKAAEAEKMSLREITDPADPALDAMYALYQRQEMTGRRERENFLTVMQSWHNGLYCVEDKGTGKCLGYISAGQGDIYELALAEEALLPGVMKAWSSLQKGAAFSVTVPLHQLGRAEAMKAFAENTQIRDDEMLLILNWPRVLERLMVFKAARQPVLDGKMCFEIAGEGRFLLCVQGGRASVLPTEEAPERSLTPRSAVEFFFSAYGALRFSRDVPGGWLPLPLHIPSADQF